LEYRKIENLKIRKNNNENKGWNDEKRWLKMPRIVDEKIYHVINKSLRKNDFCCLPRENTIKIYKEIDEVIDEDDEDSYYSSSSSDSQTDRLIDFKGDCDEKGKGRIRNG